ncbi:MAG: NAD(P)/FAD-dependent oxidoreductase, partial [Alphaproteobacteria bacterium]
MYMLYRLRELGMSARAYEAGDGVGGTWHWNRYPGARVDTETMFYSYQFSEELQQEWEWTERYPSQAELQRYADHVADRFDLWPDIQFQAPVAAATWDDDTGLWTVEIEGGETVTARICVMATGCLSSLNTPHFEGLESFAGDV